MPVGPLSDSRGAVPVNVTVCVCVCVYYCSTYSIGTSIGTGKLPSCVCFDASVCLLLQYLLPSCRFFKKNEKSPFENRPRISYTIISRGARETHKDGAGRTRRSVRPFPACRWQQFGAGCCGRRLVRLPLQTSRPCAVPGARAARAPT